MSESASHDAAGIQGVRDHAHGFLAANVHKHQHSARAARVPQECTAQGRGPCRRVIENNDSTVVERMTKHIRAV